MFTGRKSATVGRRVTAMASALALVALLSGNVAAYQLAGDDGRREPLVTPKVSTHTATSQQFRFKLETKDGRRILEFG